MRYNTVNRKLQSEKVLKWCSCLTRSGLFLLIQKASLSLRSIELFTESKIRKQEGVYIPLHEGN